MNAISKALTNIIQFVCLSLLAIMGIAAWVSGLGYLLF